ncbi:MAG: pyrroline-5-carboxylate reductase family protein [Methanosarcina sp.]
MKKSIGFIGGGKSARILLNAFDNRKLKFKRVVVSDVNPLVIERLKGHYPFVEAESASVAAGQGIVFLAMDQNMLMDTLALISSEFSSDTIIVSLAPDINFAKLALRLQNFHKIARVLPSAAGYINEAYTPVSFSSGFTQSEKDDVLDLLGNLGRAVEVPEEKLTTYSTMAAVFPAYFWHQWKEMINMGIELGLTEEETVDFINESVRSSLHLTYKSGLKEDQVADLMAFNPAEENENEIREVHKRRLIDLYRRYRPARTENASTRRTR